MRHVALVLPLLASLLTSPLTAQSAPADPQAAPYTLRSTTRLVVEDVLVTDAHNHPVAALPRTAFHLSDDNHPQTLRTFEESTTPTAPGPSDPAAAPGTFSNAALSNGSRVINVLLIDNINLEVEDQMYLRVQALHAISTLPPATAAIVFRSTGHGAPVMVQSLTSDHALLARAVENSVPAFTTPAFPSVSKALSTLDSLSSYLAQYPGRKSLLWLAGNFPLFTPLGDPGGVPGFGQMQEAIRSTQRNLEAARVAVFPIDVRGVVNVGGTINGAHSTNMDNPTGSPVTQGEDVRQRGSWAAMDELANSTGGQAFYSTNAVAQAMDNALTLARHAYTLTYSPEPYAANGAFHKVRLTVDGPFHVSYRLGYYADEPRSSGSLEAERVSAPADAGDPHPPAAVPPIVFLAEVHPAADPAPAPPGTGGIPLTVHYSITAGDLEFTHDPSSRNQARFKVAVLAYNADGDILSSAIDTVTTHYSDPQLALARRTGVPMFQQLRVRKGARFLLLSVVDLETGRTGTLQLTLASAEAAPRPGSSPAPENASHP
ncbi:VWA domain-containing protein [Acidipila sp. EB88]|uniref:VWA domain-containing protein n=1 Tax=Acidipila sp. EB88 TaxID=2305226 RepID=UPI000F5FE372|nr:VWA domain-containing protein [Acidipila sp. EB88]RRA48260.1 VWA domain-containing protein [Acidipila sp. EB88]